MKNLVQRNIQGKKVLILFILTNIIYAVMLSITIPKAMSFANDMKLLDMLPGGYDFNYVVSLLNALGEEGRHVYLLRQIPLDMIYPGLFGISYCLIFAYFIKKLNYLKSPYYYFCIIPIIAGIFDYFENFGVISLLTNFPEISENSVNITSFFSILKSATTTLYFVLLLIVLILLAGKLIRAKLNKTKII